MAAYAALASLISLMEDIQNHPCVSTFFDPTQLQSLGQNLDFLLKFVEGSNNSVGQRKELEDLESRIASEVHAAEDAIESYIVDRIQSGSTADEAEDVRSHLQNATEAMDSIKKSIMEIENDKGFMIKVPKYSPTRSQSSGKTTMVGFEDESIQLRERLTQPEPNRQVIPIVGMGGTGKTTLARFVYEHSHITQHFDICMWATISQQTRVENILSELLYGEKHSTDGTVDELGQELYQTLFGRKYLVVLDDMWSIETWSEIQLYLPHNGRGDRVIITTRLANMAALLQSVPFEMKLLDEEKGWRLFRAKAFGDEECPPELEEIGKDIVKKCKGLALSIVVIGGHLGKSSRMKLYWESVGRDINSVFDSVEDQCLSILSLSYNHLPAHLRPCFLYMGIFEEDDEFFGPRLINLWVAEGLIKGNEERSKEEIAEECLKDLADRNLIIVSKYDGLGRNYLYQIHDILRDLSIRLAKKENFFSVLDTTQTIDRERRIVIHKDIEPDFIIHPRPLVRSLLGKRGELSSKFRLLRVVIDKVVELNGGFLEPDFQNVNLRFLECDVRPKTDDSEGISSPTLHLPPSISLMWNLQTLQIYGEYGKIIAPAEIWKMSQLRRVHVDCLCLPDPPLIDDPVLGNLLALEHVENFSLSDDVCRRIPNVTRMDLRYDFSRESDEASIHYDPQNLGSFHKLEILSCSFSGRPSWHHLARDLTFPSSLQELHLSDLPLCWDDLTRISSLPHLVELDLSSSVHGSEWNAVGDGFPCLRFLKIFWCESLVSWNAERCHFPRLERLHLVGASKLDEIPSSIGDIPTLKHITLHHCSDAAVISAAGILVDQLEQGNDRFHVQVWFNNKEKLQSLSEMVGEEGLTCSNLYLKLWPVAEAAAAAKAAAAAEAAAAEAVAEAAAAEAAAVAEAAAAEATVANNNDDVGCVCHFGYSILYIDRLCASLISFLSSVMSGR